MPASSTSGDRRSLRRRGRRRGRTERRPRGFLARLGDFGSGAVGGRTLGRIPAERHGNGEQDRPVDDAVARQQVEGPREHEDDDHRIAQRAEDGQATPTGP
jgi:hypothetical protein